MFKIGNKVHLVRLCPHYGDMGIPRRYFNRTEVYVIRYIDIHTTIEHPRIGSWSVQLNMLEHVEPQYTPKKGDIKFKMATASRYSGYYWVPPELVDDPEAVLKHCGILKGELKVDVKSLIYFRGMYGGGCLRNIGTKHR